VNVAPKLFPLLAALTDWHVLLSKSYIATKANHVSANGFEPRSRFPLCSARFPRDRFANLLKEFGAGDEARTRNFQLGKYKFSILYFQYLQNRLEKMYVHRCIPCMHRLICVLLRDVWGTVSDHEIAARDCGFEV
jgi:hypothetical protein